MPKLTAKEVNNLSLSPIFEGIPVTELDSLLKDDVEIGHFYSGEIIFSPLHFEERLGILLSGSAVAVKPGGVVLNHFGPGSCFGVATLFSPHKTYVTTVKAQQDCSIAFFSEEAMRQLFREREQIALNYITFLSSRIHFLNRKIDKFTAVSAEEKLALWLLEQLESGNSIIQMSCSYAQLADMLDLGRASLYRAFDHWEAVGVLRKEKKLLYVLDADKLLTHTN